MNKKITLKIKWTPDVAYIVGLVATDGSLSKDKRHVDFTSKDIQLIKTFKKCLGIENKIGLKRNGYSDKKYFHIQFGDAVFYNWLLSIGLMPRKSKIIGALKVPDKYFFDFLRGSFDGDGSCYSYWDKRWRNSFMFYLEFNSASEKHILWLKDKFEKFLKVKGYFRKGNNSVYTLRFAKEDSKKIISKMYYKKGLPCLVRKYQKIKKILKVENKENDID